MTMDMTYLNYTNSDFFEFDKETGTIIALKISINAVSIPPKIDGVEVTTIGKKAFNRSDIKSIIIPNSVTTIEEFAFFRCVSLERVEISSSVRKIEKYAFGECSSMDELIFHEGVEEIEKHAFSGCISLAYIKIPASVREIHEYAFMNCHSLRDAYIPLTTKVSCNAFDGCQLPDSFMKHIRNTDGYPFVINNGVIAKVMRCSDGIARIPDFIGDDQVRAIDEHAFECRNDLVRVDFPISVTKIGRYAFSECLRLRNINIDTNRIDIEREAFRDCISAEELVISVRGIRGDVRLKKRAFMNCRGLKRVKIISNGDVIIGKEAFMNCENLKDVKIVFGGDVQLKGDVFKYCASLESVSILRDKPSLST